MGVCWPAFVRPAPRSIRFAHRATKCLGPSGDDRMTRCLTTWLSALGFPVLAHHHARIHGSRRIIKQRAISQHRHEILADARSAQKKQRAAAPYNIAAFTAINQRCAWPVDHDLGGKINAMLQPAAVAL